MVREVSSDERHASVEGGTLGFKDVLTAVLELAVVVGAAMFAVLPSAGWRLLLPSGRLVLGAMLTVVAVMTVFALTRGPGHSL